MQQRRHILRIDWRRRPACARSPTIRPRASPDR